MWCKCLYVMAVNPRGVLIIATSALQTTAVQVMGGRPVRKETKLTAWNNHRSVRLQTAGERRTWAGDHLLRLVACYQCCRQDGCRHCQPWAGCAGVAAGPARVPGLAFLAGQRAWGTRCLRVRGGGWVSHISCQRNQPLSLPLSSLTASFFVFKETENVNTNQIVNNPSEQVVIQMKKPRVSLTGRRN